MFFPANLNNRYSRMIGTINRLPVSFQYSSCDAVNRVMVRVPCFTSVHGLFVTVRNRPEHGERTVAQRWKTFVSSLEDGSMLPGRLANGG